MRRNPFLAAAAMLLSWAGLGAVPAELSLSAAKSDELNRLSYPTEFSRQRIRRNSSPKFKNKNRNQRRRLMQSWMAMR